jgi:paraquat-inducible protein B
VALRTTLDQSRVLAQKLNSRVDPLADSVTNTLAEADRALTQARGAAENLRIQLGPDAPLPANLDQTLRQLSEAVQSLSTLLELLEQHPNALISGRQNPQEKP